MKYFFSLLLGLAIFVGLSGVARADVNNFVINDFHADYTLSNGVPGGSLDTSETIKVTFTDQNHGIFRYVPKSYRGYSTKLKVGSITRDGKAEQYQTYTENGNLVMKIGDPNTTITGQHIYNISYHQDRVVNFYRGKPEFYWDVNGTSWPQAFEKVSATLTLKGQSLNDTQKYCYTGPQGALLYNCTITDQLGSVNVETTKLLNGYEGLTLAVSMPSGVFVKPSWKDKLKDYAGSIVGLLIAIAGAIYAFILWRKYGKDTGYRGVVVPEYEPPNGLKPAEVGLLADFRVDSRDLSATLIDLAVRKYIRLHEDEKKLFFITSKNYSVELLSADLSLLNGLEKNLLQGIFSNLSEGKIVDLKKLDKMKMSAELSQGRKSLQKDLQDKYGLTETLVTPQFYLLVVFTVIYAIATFVFRLPGLVAGLFVLGASVIFAGIFMKRRTTAGVEAYEKIMGLKMYMDVAEKDRLKMMQSVDRPYAEPSKTVDLFEKLLPYAVALGVEKSWAKQFDGILTERPDWISSNSAAAFSGANLASSISSATGSFSSSFETSSGSSGGGSSGGGGGGGGGGGW